jgi:hypothetical protein
MGRFIALAVVVMFVVAGIVGTTRADEADISDKDFVDDLISQLTVVLGDKYQGLAPEARDLFEAIVKRADRKRDGFLTPAEQITVHQEFQALNKAFGSFLAKP